MASEEVIGEIGCLRFIDGVGLLDSGKLEV